jgi:hypothetical protein
MIAPGPLRAAVRDVDSDGISDVWEGAYFGARNRCLPAADVDRDTQSNLQEYIAGTNPTNAGSYFGLHSLRTSDQGVDVEWDSVTNRSYRIYWQESLTNIAIVAQSGIMHPIATYSDSNHLAASSGFYRMDVELLDTMELVDIELSNAGFESGWNDWEDEDPSAISGVTYSGLSSAKITGSGGSFSQEIDVAEETDYVLSVFVNGSWSFGVRLDGEEISRNGMASGWTQEEVGFNSETNTSVTIFADYFEGEGRYDDFALTASVTEVATNPVLVTISSVIASSDDGNLPQNVLDGNLSTRWSTSEEDAWIRANLGEEREVCTVSLAWHNGDQNGTSYAIQSGVTTNEWTTRYDGTTLGDTIALEPHDFSAFIARYIQVVCEVSAEPNAFGLTELEVYALDDADGPLTYPSDLIPELTVWKLTLPVDANGDDSSAATDVADRNTNPLEISDSDLTDYDFSPYFRAAGDEILFRAHCGGATTDGSYYPRSELRQRVGGGDNYWSVDDYQYMAATLRVTHLPVEKPEVCMAQIHGPLTEPFRLQYHAEKGLLLIWNEDNKIYFEEDVSYSLGQTLNVTVTVDDGQIYFTIENADTEETYAHDWTSVDSTGYFKVGCYTQSSMFLSQFKDDSNDESPSAYGEVAVSAIELVETYTTDDTTAPGSVSNLQATPGDGQVTLQWSNPTDSDFDVVEISYSNLTVTTSGSSKTLTGLANGEAVEFTLTAYDKSGNASDPQTVSAMPVAGGGGAGGITGEVVHVSSLSALSDAIAEAVAGQTLVLADGTYSGEIEGVTSLIGTADNPITIRAESLGGVNLDLDSTLAIKTCSYVILQGFNFTSDEYSMMKIIHSDHISILDNVFDEEWATDNKKTVVVNASAGISTDIEFGYNVFKNKDGQGGFITTEYDEIYGISTTHHIHHNYFLNMMSEINASTGDFEGDSDREAVCFGVSDSAALVTQHLVEYNLFEDCDGENEIITVKTDSNVLRHNTFKNCLGSLSLRFGDNHEVYGNIFYGDDTENNEETGGIRLYGKNQKIYNNYFYNLTGQTSTHRMPLVIDGGGSGDHSKVEDSFIAFNTIVDCYYGIGVGMNYSSAPVDNTIGNNIIVNSTMNNITVVAGDDSNVWEGNISFNANSTDDSSYVYSYDNPNLVLSDGIYKLTGSSINAIDHAVDQAGVYSDVTTDIDGGIRGSVKDIGADEYGATGGLTLLTAADVGPR